MNKEVEVKWAQLKSPLFIPYGVGNYKNILTADATGPDKNIKMYLQSNGSLLVVTKGVQLVVAESNISHMVFCQAAV